MKISWTLTEGSVQYFIFLAMYHDDQISYKHVMGESTSFHTTHYEFEYSWIRLLHKWTKAVHCWWTQNYRTCDILLLLLLPVLNHNSKIIKSLNGYWIDFQIYNFNWKFLLGLYWDLPLEKCNFGISEDPCAWTCTHKTENILFRYSWCYTTQHNIVSYLDHNVGIEDIGWEEHPENIINKKASQQ